VAKYNDVMSYISSQSLYDTAKKTAGILAGDHTMRAAHMNLSAVLHRSIKASGHSLNLLSQTGIKLTSNGTVSLDERTLRDRLSSDFNDTAYLFLGDGENGGGNNNSILAALQSRLDSLTDTIDGPVFHASDAMEQNISRLNRKIEEMEARLEVRREVLIAQFSKADAALRQLSVLQSSLEGLVDSLSSL